MVRFKKRYFVVQFDREKDILNSKPRAFQDSRPLDISDIVLANSIKDIVQFIHGDFGRASVTTGLKTIYCNKETRLAIIQCRHGPHRLVGSSLPFLTKINEEKVVARLIYTGATVKNCNAVSFCFCINCASNNHRSQSNQKSNQHKPIFFTED